ncbi:unnamed protein product [Parnassius apollo]|uniref:(apollo) hypothetical protein n=1 Tax=Parnassius apollo TaxID=110799 RepID=A0A8S3WQ81_PARAO|nr:unnamed protein product [Parnassius apollo]
MRSLFQDKFPIPVLMKTKCYQKRNGWEALDETELDAYLGILIFAGVFKSNDESLESLWSEAYGRPIFRATMSLKRFKQISAILRLDKRSDREARKQSDKLAAILGNLNSQASTGESGNQPDKIPEVQDMDAEALAVLGEINIEQEKGPPLHPEIANRWTPILSKGLKKLRPNNPKYQFTCNVSEVFNHLELHQMDTKDVKFQAKKTAMLFALATGQRAQTLASVEIDKIKIEDDKICY